MKSINIIECIKALARDTGWITIPITSNFKNYTASSTPKCRRIGNVVCITGELSPAKSGTGSTTTIDIGTLPVGFAPASRLCLLCQGSADSKWALEVNTNRTLNFSRYSNKDGYTSYSNTSWLPFTITYFVDSDFPANLGGQHSLTSRLKSLLVKPSLVGGVA